MGESWCPTLTSGRCSTAPNSIETALARRDWAELMVGVAAVWVMAGRGGGAGGGMEDFGFRMPLGLNIMAWIFISTHTEEVACRFVMKLKRKNTFRIYNINTCQLTQILIRLMVRY